MCFMQNTAVFSTLDGFWFQKSHKDNFLQKMCKTWKQNGDTPGFFFVFQVFANVKQNKTQRHGKTRMCYKTQCCKGMTGRYLGYGSCLLLEFATSVHPHHRQCPPLPSNAGNVALHAVSNPVWTSPQCHHMPLPWLVEEACGMWLTVINFPAQCWKELLNWTQKWGLWGQVECNKSIMVGEPVLNRAARWNLTSSQMTTNWGCSGPSHQVYL